MSDEARAVLDRAQEAAQAARAFATGERSEIQLGYAPSPTVELLPQALQAFQKDSPGVRVTLHDSQNRLKDGKKFEFIFRLNPEGQ